MTVTLGLVGIKMSNLAVGKITPDDRLSFSILEASMNGTKYAKPNDVLNNCIAASQGKDISIATNNFMEVGNHLEKPVMELLAKRLGLIDVQYEITEPVRHKHLELNGSLDGLGVANDIFVSQDEEKGFYLPEHDEGEGIKLNGNIIIEIKIATGFGETVLPAWRGVTQVKAAMATCEYDYAVIGVLYGSDLRLFFYERDLDWEKNVLEPHVKDFTRRIIEGDLYPPFDNQECADMYPIDNGKTICLPDYALELIESREHCDKTMKILKQTKDECDRALKALMQESSQGNIGDYVVQWKTTHYKAQPEKTKIIEAKSARTTRNILAIRKSS